MILGISLCSNVSDVSNVEQGEVASPTIEGGFTSPKSNHEFTNSLSCAYMNHLIEIICIGMHQTKPRAGYTRAD